MKTKTQAVFGKIWYAGGTKAAYLLQVNPVDYLGSERWMRDSGIIKFRVTYWTDKHLANDELLDYPKVYEFPRIIAFSQPFYIEYGLQELLIEDLSSDSA